MDDTVCGRRVYYLAQASLFCELLRNGEEKMFFEAVILFHTLLHFLLPFNLCRVTSFDAHHVLTFSFISMSMHSSWETARFARFL